MKKTYKLLVSETRALTYNITANNKEEAEEIYWKGNPELESDKCIEYYIVEIEEKQERK